MPFRLIRNAPDDIFLLSILLTFCNGVAAVAPPGQSMNCYVCNSGPPSQANKNCPPSGITAPYLIRNEACYGRCFIKTHDRNPNVIYRGCTDAYPELPAELPVDKCHTYTDELWCFCVLNMCNRGSIDDLRNPPKEEDEEEEEEGPGYDGLTRGKQRLQPQGRQQQGTAHSKYNKKPTLKLPLQPERSRWATPSSNNQVRPQWHLKRIPPEITDWKSSVGGAEAYLDVRVTNTSANITMMKDSPREETNETLRDFQSKLSTANDISCCLYLSAIRAVVLIILLTLVLL